MRGASRVLLVYSISPDVSPDSVARAFQGARSAEFAAAPAHPCARGIPFILNITEKRTGVLVQYVEHGEGTNSAEGVP